MNRVLALMVAFTLLVGQFLSIAAQTTGTGVITGTISGPSGPLVGVTVQVLDTAGVLVGTAMTTEAGLFSVTGLTAGTFTVQAVAANGSVLGLSAATLAAGSMSVAVTVNATAGTLAAAAAAATAAETLTATATGAGVKATTVLAAVGATAAAVGTVAILSTKEDASGSR